MLLKQPPAEEAAPAEASAAGSPAEEAAPADERLQRKRQTASVSWQAANQVRLLVRKGSRDSLK